MSDKTEQLRSILSLLGASATKQEIVDAFKAITKYVTDIKQGNEKEWSLIKSAISMLGDNLKDQNKSELDKTKQDLMDSVEKAITILDSRVASLKDGEDGEDGEDGKDADETKIIAEVLAKIPKVVDETPEQTRDKLETLKEDERLDKSAVKGIENIEEDIKQIKLRPIGRSGVTRGFQLLVNGTKKLLTAQEINLVAGSGITISYAYASGRNDITITAAGSASLTPIAVTGTIDDSNTSFTAASTPNIVIINGASYRSGHGVTITGTAITTDNPIGTGSDIYAL